MCRGIDLFGEVISHEQNMVQLLMSCLLHQKLSFTVEFSESVKAQLVCYHLLFSYLSFVISSANSSSFYGVFLNYMYLF